MSREDGCNDRSDVPDSLFMDFLFSLFIALSSAPQTGSMSSNAANLLEAGSKLAAPGRDGKLEEVGSTFASRGCRIRNTSSSLKASTFNQARLGLLHTS